MYRHLSTAQQISEATRHHGCRRNGLSLVEMVTVISLIAVISTLTARCVSLLMHLGESTTNAASTTNAVEQLQKALRIDVHAANAATQKMDNTQSITLQKPDGSRVVYSVVDQEIRKVATSPTGQESFEIYQFKTHHPALKLADDTAQVILTPLSRNNDTVVLGRNELRITAVIGAMQRHVNKAANGSAAISEE